MRSIRIIGVCVVAALAISALAATSAFAEAPEFGKCIALKGGKFENSGCTKEAKEVAKQKFEWEPLTKPVLLTGKMKEATLATLETVKGTKIVCKNETNVGEIANAKESANVIATFEGCETGGLKCESAGQLEGIIVTNPLSGVLGVEKLGTTPPINNKLASELHGPGGGPLAEFSCAGIPIVVTGSVLHPVAAGKMLLTTTEKFTASKGEQKPDHFLGGVADEHALGSSTAGGTPEEAGQTITAIVTFSEKGEANPVV